jgi:hypothetical protein
MTYIEKPNALVKLGRLFEAEGLLNTAMEPAEKSARSANPAKLTLRFGLSCPRSSYCPGSTAM